MNYPFNDGSMTYDFNTHRYTLTKDGVFNELGINLDTRLNVAQVDNPSTAAAVALNMISRHLYNFIYARTANKAYIEMLLAKYAPCREVIKQCLLNEVQYTLKSGDFWNYAGVNLVSGSAVDISALRDSRVVSSDSEALLYQRLPNGVCLLYQGRLNTPLFNLYEGY